LSWGKRPTSSPTAYVTIRYKYCAYTTHRNLGPISFNFRMAQDGAVKILQGVTSFDELNRVVDLYDEVMLETIA